MKTFIIIICIGIAYCNAFQEQQGKSIFDEEFTVYNCSSYEVVTEITNPAKVLFWENNRWELIHYFGPGYTILKAGSVAYIAKCAKINAKLQFRISDDHIGDRYFDSEICPDKIPILSPKDVEPKPWKWYADPFTYIIKYYFNPNHDFPEGEELNTYNSKKHPTKYWINERFVCCYPKHPRDWLGPLIKECEDS